MENPHAFFFFGHNFAHQVHSELLMLVISTLCIIGHLRFVHEAQNVKPLSVINTLWSQYQLHYHFAIFTVSRLLVVEVVALFFVQYWML